MLKLVPVTKENFKDVPEQCRRCFYWQTTKASNGRTMTENMENKRLEWLLKTTKKHGHSVGLIAYHNHTLVGFVQCAQAQDFPNVRECDSGPPSEDAAFLACLYIPNREDQKKGLGTLMLKEETPRLRQLGYNAVETFARKSSPENPSGPLKFYLENGFKIQRDDSDFPLVRLELR
jgi:hypothetical protein